MAGKSRANVFEIASRALIASTEVADLPDIALELKDHESSASTNAHQISNISGLDYALSNKAAVSHTHTIINISGLQSALDGKQNIISGHNGSLTIVTSINFANSTFETAQLNIVNGIITKIN